MQFAIGGEKWSLWNGNAKLQQADSNATLYDIIWAPHITEWWVSNLHFGADYIQQINWAACAMCRCDERPEHLPAEIHYKTLSGNGPVNTVLYE
jgi:hypothetical protein